MAISVRPKDRARSEWFEVPFVRLRDGFREHLRYFSTCPDALLVFVWAIQNRDHETGELVADRRAIMLATGLSDWRVKRALGFLRHGRRCSCEKCRGFNPEDWTVRPSYLAEVRGAFRGSPPILKIRRDDSEFLAAARRSRKEKRDRQIPLGYPQTGDNFGDNSRRGAEGEQEGER